MNNMYINFIIKEMINLNEIEFLLFIFLFVLFLSLFSSFFLLKMSSKKIITERDKLLKKEGENINGGDIN